MNIIIFGDNSSCVRPSDGTDLGFDSHLGPMQLHVIKRRFEAGWGALVYVPNNEINRKAFASSGVSLDKDDPIVPPFIMLPESFKKGTPFYNKGRSEDPLKNEKYAKIAEPCSFNPEVRKFIPARLGHLDRQALDQSIPDWDLNIWESGMRVHAATDEERSFRRVPSEVYPVKYLDKFLEDIKLHGKGSS